MSHDPQADDALVAMRAQLDDLDAVDLDRRAGVFERLNAALAHELSALDEV